MHEQLLRQTASAGIVPTREQQEQDRARNETHYRFERRVPRTAVGSGTRSGSYTHYPPV